MMPRLPPFETLCVCVACERRLLVKDAGVYLRRPWAAEVLTRPIDRRKPTICSRMCLERLLVGPIPRVPAPIPFVAARADASSITINRGEGEPPELLRRTLGTKGPMPDRPSDAWERFDGTMWRPVRLPDVPKDAVG